ncbi:MAG: hypothetical protein A2836_02960 [Candidatus Taylorbacteria bacterium RIFCSPHIGHO2_01_FULL_45_63]|uniref:TraC-like domain-containing protein n=1 Tax=Candidatus Taylorbacteria bacterium RIFCSPHIGHO2_02_FULL_45_35 TaxID=1802311 RepID=A0A1G2MUX0_9BACT|nr:MAG: hypothetical protein A2836_02960 [Candidatus Taylorbacteria bacterium RIFCSPHIGHO2_01_FULL_45_63]OHA27554.1 MAG: hypothetical protein A3D56_02555 [Candidatus Taylorbacteria bacterium RIFCSPHIGHO2_02_FULL_45_35]OHA34183.1 MAG: hypothetical protein A3A22_00800 [Candidatus Taylorbacteria bacterium RIFCSPLOWO2_01_FULL_45_34b]
MAPQSKATQDFVPIKEVRDGVVVLKNGSMRAVLMCSSVNFALKAQDMQEAIVLQFQSFLNSLDFSIQIFIQSRRLDIRPYVTLLEEREKKQTIELLKIQTREYIGFIKNFTENTSIMSKTFFVVVPYTPAILNAKSSSSLLGKVLGKKQTSETKVAEKAEAFEEARTQVEQRLAVVEQGLIRTGIRTVQLGTEEVIELFYKLLNPGDTDKPIPLN